jgi:hypothetical protein
MKRILEFTLMGLLATALSHPLPAQPAFSDANWTSMGGIPGANAYVYAAVVDESGTLYVGGNFTAIGDVNANCIAKWDGRSWSPLGSGIEGGPPRPFVRALAVSGSDVYAAGSFTIAGGIVATNIAKWDGTNWSSLGLGMNFTVEALAVLSNDLYAGGGFTMAGGSASYIAKWDGSRWSPLGSGVSSAVNALVISGSDVYVGGYFQIAGNTNVSHVAKWDGSSWSPLSSGINGEVDALTVSEGNLYAGGKFTIAGSVAATNIAQWNGSSWSALGSGISGPPDFPYYGGGVSSLAVAGRELFAGGGFTTAGGTNAGCIAKWNGSSWSALGSGMKNYDFVYALAALGSDLFAGGLFTTAGGINANYIAKWSGSSWSAVGSGMNTYANALVASGSDLYAGGDFTTAGGVSANHIAKWNGSGWSALGSGIDGNVYALAVSETNLYAGGEFTSVGGIAAHAIAKWNGSSWSALGSGLTSFPANGTVDALATSGSDVYAGGNFTTAGGIAATNIARWDGTNWSPLGSGLSIHPNFNYSGAVYALAVSGTDLYAGGNFTNSGGANVNYVAKWDGTNWLALGSGTGGGNPNFGPPAVYALVVLGSDLYVGGFFTTAGGMSANYIAKWDGNIWSALGSGMDGGARALALSGGDLYVGGGFTTAGGIGANCIAKWRGSSWSALGSGANSGVLALAVSDSELYAGGWFTRAGDKMSAYLGRVRIGSIVRSLVATNSTASIEFSGVTGYEYDVQRATNLNVPITWTNLSINPLSPADDGFFSFTDTNAPLGNAYYRAVER